jgi:hypothetical protein
LRKIQSKFNTILAGVTFTGDIEAPGITATGSFTSPGIDDNATSTAITIDPFEKVGIGVSSPIEKLNIGGDSVVKMNIVSSSTTGTSGIQFGDPDDVNAGRLEYDHGPDRLQVQTAGAVVLQVESSGDVVPGSDNVQQMGSASLRWSEVFAGTGTINTSDAREKTAVRGMTESEVSAAKDMSKEIGIYQFLASVEKKGDNARQHVGLTVQRAIEIMTAHDLEPFEYGFICFDEWDDVFVEHAEVLAVEESEGVESVEAKAAWIDQTQVAGNRYGFRYDQLNLFIAKGIEARLSALEHNA